MKQMSERMKFTYADLQTLPEDGKRYELFDGELIMTHAPSLEHQNAVGNLHYILSNYVRGVHNPLLVTFRLRLDRQIERSGAKRNGVEI